MKILHEAAFERKVQERVDVQVGIARREMLVGEAQLQDKVTQLESDKAGLAVQLTLEQDKCRRLVARLREWETKFHQLELAAASHDLVVEEKAAVPAKPNLLVLKRRK